MNDKIERISEHFEWHPTFGRTGEIVDRRDCSRRPESAYEAKVDVYEDRVRCWFLDIAHQHTLDENAPKDYPGDYVALLIALAYVEGIERHRQGKKCPKGEAGKWFKASACRLFPSADSTAIERLWTAARNGLFHSGFTDGPTILCHSDSAAIAIAKDFLRINPARFVATVIEDFESYVAELRADPQCELATRFTTLWDELWRETLPTDYESQPMVPLES